MTKYTVILLYPDYINDDGTETYLGHVEGDSPEHAIGLCQDEAARENVLTEGQNGQAGDFAVLAIFEGHHFDIHQR